MGQKTIKDVGRETASYWLQASLNGSKEQAANQIEVLKEAAIHILGTYAFNQTKPECNAEPISEGQAILNLRQEIEDEVQFMHDNTSQNEFTDLNKEGK
jgi:hypothetical protein